MVRYNKVLFKVWEEFIVDGLCGLCGNHGIVKTDTLTARGKKIGVRQECICPNGRALRKVRLRTAV